MLQIVNTINSYLSDYILVFLLVAVGLWYTVKTKCVERYLLQMQRAIFRADRCIISRQPLKANLANSWQAFFQSQLFLLLDFSDAWYSPTQLDPQFRWHSGFRPGL